MKIACIAYAAVPSRAASSVHAMKLCQAFVKQGHDVTLYTHRGPEPVHDIYSYYGVPHAFEVVYCPRPSLKDVGSLFYGLAVAHAIKARPLPDLCYGLEIYSLMAAAPLDAPMVFESHLPPRRVVGKSVQGWGFRRRNFR